MKTTSSGEIILDSQDSERLSKLIEWAAQFVLSIHYVTVQEVEQFIQDWKAETQKQSSLNAGLSITNYKDDK